MYGCCWWNNKTLNERRAKKRSKEKRQFQRVVNRTKLKINDRTIATIYFEWHGVKILLANQFNWIVTINMIVDFRFLFFSLFLFRSPSNLLHSSIRIWTLINLKCFECAVAIIWPCIYLYFFGECFFFSFKIIIGWFDNC